MGRLPHVILVVGFETLALWLERPLALDLVLGEAPLALWLVHRLLGFVLGLLVVRTSAQIQSELQFIYLNYTISYTIYMKETKLHRIHHV